MEVNSLFINKTIHIAANIFPPISRRCRFNNYLFKSAFLHNVSNGLKVLLNVSEDTNTPRVSGGIIIRSDSENPEFDQHATRKTVKNVLHFRVTDKLTSYETSKTFGLIYSEIINSGFSLDLLSGVDPRSPNCLHQLSDVGNLKSLNKKKSER